MLATNSDGRWRGAVPAAKVSMSIGAETGPLIGVQKGPPSSIVSGLSR
jgi:hypothetical protein